MAIRFRSLLSVTEKYGVVIDCRFVCLLHDALLNEMLRTKLL